jgi:hypothetical protein
MGAGVCFTDAEATQKERRRDEVGQAPGNQCETDAHSSAKWFRFQTVYIQEVIHVLQQ